MSTTLRSELPKCLSCQKPNEGYENDPRTCEDCLTLFKYGKTQVNSLPVSVRQHQELLMLFPEAWQAKLRLYTGEELFYCYKLCMFDAKRDKITHDFKGGDLFFATLKVKLKAYLKGLKRPGAYGVMIEAQPINPNAWLKLGRKWAKEYNAEYVFDQPVAEQAEIAKLKDSLNNRRIA